MEKKNQIVDVWIERAVDTDPDLSFLGRYSSTPTEHSIDRQELGDMGRNECRYFIPAMTGEESGNPDSPMQDYRRMEAYNKGDWWMVGIIAKAQICTPSGLNQVIHSMGLWGIESDSSADFFNEIEQEELNGLRRELESLGFGKRAIDYRFKDYHRKNA